MKLMTEKHHTDTHNIAINNPLMLFHCNAQRVGNSFIISNNLQSISEALNLQTQCNSVSIIISVTK